MRQQAMLTNRRKAQLIIIATFLFGTVVGASGYYLLSRQPLINQSAPPPNTLNEITRAVGLTAEQRTQIEQMLDDSRREQQELRTQIRPQFTAIRMRCRERIRTILSPEQQELYDKWNQEQDAKREQKPK
jgi:Spy/CpxP family protein refolding chaperone